MEVYQREFLDLSRYAEEDIPTDERRQEKFCEGLRHDIQRALLALDFPDFATMVNKAILVETGLIGLRKHPDVTVRRAHLRAHLLRSAVYGSRRACIVQ